MGDSATTAKASANRTGVYLAFLQLVFTLGWTTYVIYLPKLAAEVGIAPSAVILILMLDQAIFTITDTAMGIAADKIAPIVGRLGAFVGTLTALSCAAFVALPFVAGTGPGAQVWFIALIVIWSVTSSALRAPPLTLLGKLDNAKRQIDASGNIAGLDRFEQQALDMIVRGAGDAFDLTKEDRPTRDRYDTSSFRVGKKLFQPSGIGRQMLMARRLVEAGCGFVTVQNSGWDMHADGNNPGIGPGMQMLGPPLDKALGAFLDDLDSRGLTEKVLLIITGDFGRTPTINARGGRDHYPKLCTLAFFGGGLARGQIIGQSSRKNDAPATDPISPANLLSTVLHALFNVGQMRLDPAAPRELVRLAEAAPIAELF
jgi:hypothetical protein